MAKIPSRKFPKTKKKIPSRKFPKSERKIPSKKFAKAAVVASKKQDAQVPLGRLTNEEERQVWLVNLTGQMKSVLPASKLSSDS
jgi:hypothetical protein